MTCKLDLMFLNLEVIPFTSYEYYKVITNKNFKPSNVIQNYANGCSTGNFYNFIIAALQS